MSSATSRYPAMSPKTVATGGVHHHQRRRAISAAPGDVLREPACARRETTDDVIAASSAHARLDDDGDQANRDNPTSTGCNLETPRHRHHLARAPPDQRRDWPLFSCLQTTLWVVEWLSSRLKDVLARGAVLATGHRVVVSGSAPVETCVVGLTAGISHDHVI